jgi:hypothetical protein
MKGVSPPERLCGDSHNSCAHRHTYRKPVMVGPAGGLEESAAG